MEYGGKSTLYVAWYIDRIMYLLFGSLCSWSPIGRRESRTLRSMLRLLTSSLRPTPLIVLESQYRHNSRLRGQLYCLLPARSASTETRRLDFVVCQSCSSLSPPLYTGWFYVRIVRQWLWVCPVISEGICEHGRLSVVI